MERAQIMSQKESSITVPENMTKEECFKFNVMVMKKTLSYFRLLKYKYYLIEPFPPHQEEYPRLLDPKITRDIDICIEQMIYFSQELFKRIQDFEDLFASEIAVAKMVKDEKVGL